MSHQTDAIARRAMNICRNACMQMLLYNNLSA
jgi:hypothetical protein